METKFKVGDKIIITKTSFEAKKRYQVGDIKTIIGENRQGFVVDSNWQHENPAYIGNHETVNPCYKCEWELVEKNPRLHATQIGDLLWNDELGICKIDSIACGQKYPISVISDSSSDLITLDGKRYKDSPKATFFYYSEEDHYLTERPVDVVDWSKVEEGTKVIPWDEKEPLNDEKYYGTFMAYLPHLEYHFWVYYEGNSTKDNARGFKFCKLAEPCKPKWRK